MNIWSRLGVSVALVAVFCIAAAELLQPSLWYERHKWSVCAILGISGAVLLLTGRSLNRRIQARYLESQAELPEQDRDTDPRQWEPFLLMNLAYWGLMLVIFGSVTAFLVPTHAKRDEATVTARTPEPVPEKPQPATNALPQIPHFALQGIVLRHPAPSALINGRTYFVGDFIQGAQLMAIESNSVMLEWSGTKLTLPPPR